MATHAKDRRLVLHIGIHKTATTYVQNVLSARRYDLLREGVLYPLAGSGLLARGVDRPTTSTREGAQSGHLLLTRRAGQEAMGDLLAELPESASTVLLSSEDFSLGYLKPLEYLTRFSVFGSVDVVVVLRRQDQWIESFYKQVVDQYGNFETASFEQYVAREGRRLLDFHARLSPWRDLVGPDHFHVLSFDDLPGGGDAICRRIVELAGVEGPLLESLTALEVPRYASVRPIDTVGLRVLNALRLDDRGRRIAAAKLIYDAAPEGEIELMTPSLREAIVSTCSSQNELIEKEWFTEPVPGFRFGFPPPVVQAPAPSSQDLLDYLDRVLEICARTGQAAADPDSA